MVRREVATATWIVWRPASSPGGAGRPGSSSRTARGRRAGAARSTAAVDSPRTTYCVLSSSERRTFPDVWGVDRGRVVFTPFYWTLPWDDPSPEPGGHGVFAGGDSLRDYDTLVSAAARLDVPVTIASRQRPTVPVPRNVTLGRVPMEDSSACCERARSSSCRYARGCCGVPGSRPT